VSGSNFVCEASEEWFDLNAQNEGSQIPDHLMDIELRYTHKMQITIKNLVPTALKVFISFWAKGFSFCEVYRLGNVTIVSIDLDGKGCVLPSDAERNYFIEKEKKLLTALIDAPEEEIDLCIRPSDVLGVRMKKLWLLKSGKQLICEYA